MKKKTDSKKTCDGVLQAAFAFGLAIVLPFLLGVRLNYISTTKIYYNFYGGRKKTGSFHSHIVQNCVRGMQSADNTVVNFDFCHCFTLKSDMLWLNLIII